MTVTDPPPPPGPSAPSTVQGDDGVEVDGGHERRPLRHDPVSIAVLALLTVPFLVGAVAARSTEWWPASDLALLDLRLRDVGTEHTPLLGPFSRFSWSHPGPLLYWLLAPVHRLLGGTASAGLAAAALQNAVVVVGAGVVARRVGGRRFLLLFGLATAALLQALAGDTATGTDVLVSTWNPWIALVPFVALVLLTWGVSGGDLTLVPWWVVAASYLVQSHVGYGALVIALGAWAAVGLGLELATRRRADPDRWPATRHRLVRVVTVAAVVGGVLWVGPLIDQATEDPGNLRAIASYFRSSDTPPVGLGVATDVAARQLSPVAPWLGGSEHLDFLARLAPTSPLLALPLAAAFVATAVLAWRRRDLLALRLHVTAAVGLAAGWLATSRITDQPYYYLFRWWWVLAMTAWLAVGWTVLRHLPARWAEPLRRAAAPVALGGMAVLVGLAAVSTADPVEVGPYERSVESLTPQLLGQLEPGATYVIRPIGFSWFETYFGLIDQLERNGVHVLVDPQFTAHVGRRRVLGDERAPDVEPAGELLVATGSAVRESEDDPDLALVAIYDPLTPAEREELESLQGEQKQRLRDAGKPELVDRVENEGVEILASVEPALDPVAATRIAELLRQGERAAVFQRR